jgi:predicted dehydrogenase
MCTFHKHRLSVQKRGQPFFIDLQARFPAAWIICEGRISVMIRLGVIGRNFVVDWMLAAARQVPELQIAAAYSRQEQTGREFAEKYGIPLVFTDLNKLAGSRDVDAVYIASPICCHYEQALLLLRAGKHVLCEKPVTSNAREVRALVAAAREKGVVFLEAMRFVFDDALPIIRDALPRVGALRRVTFEFTQYSSRYDRIRAGETGINAFDPALSNAAIMDMGCYCVHGIVTLFGKPDTVAAHAVHLPGGFEAEGIVLMGYPSFTAEAVYSKISRQIAPTTLLGEDGAILLDDINHIRRVWFQPRIGEPEDLGYREKLPNNMMYELREFCGYVDRGEQPTARNEASILTMEILDEARRQTGTHFPADDKM